ncbi:MULTISPECIES: RES family NAD+ phosphorylase [unclassified Sphingobium]|uniref:RES family NAD+ phosphorylase n=1 Tax=unclassified Sphingobium TaxID=2611147 RepID=UPI000D17614F|nr:MULTISPECIES: RES family NAD+ phosphorylase [unclassified Sphingobium]MBG6119345.1 hypothetical protein [Sphingobium sp. JAI105]PSO10914.1 RES domain-containing protein [Sphingobium sp. AEW4]TWD04825.1 RES domain-containing protein [Sphingobium sp. AEW010]TWD22233.1 RES domain-containing protein [Sphingobium sp. AEW013]TWD24722.1 RES domain-containing protein [Sphingobium sp. AEW001]
MADDEEAQRICHRCVGDFHLKALIVKDGAVGECSYCAADDEACISVEDLADHVEGAFDRHYQRTSDQPNMYESMLLRDKEIDYDWDRHGEPVIDVIGQAAVVEEEVAQDVLAILSDRHGDWDSAQMGEETEFHPDSYYESKRPSSGEIAAEWYGLERSLKLRSRYFNPQAESLLKRLFDDLERLFTHDGRSVVVEAGPDKAIRCFNRARAFHHSHELDEAMIRPDLHLGPPPANRAKAGRMNAHGIAVFYGADDRDIALAEVRPPVGSRALIGDFELLQTVRLLDVSALETVYFDGSVFDPAYAEQRSLARFLGRLSDRITIPVMPDDESTEYLITQMIADYLARRPAPGLDGILFKSVQRPGEKRNVVLFHHASRVEEIEIPEDVKVSVHQFQTSDDGPEPDYTVMEEVPPAAEPPAEPEPDTDFALGSMTDFRPEMFRYDPNADEREPYLRVNRDTLIVRHVTGVTFDTTDYPVHRHRSKKHDLF